MLLMAGRVRDDSKGKETVLRGLLLGGLTRHISFGWANTRRRRWFATIHVSESAERKIPPPPPFLLRDWVCWPMAGKENPGARPGVWACTCRNNGLAVAHSPHGMWWSLHGITTGPPEKAGLFVCWEQT
jgi:hypothetical protein